MKNDVEFFRKEKVFKNDYYNQSCVQKEDFRKIENTCLAKSFSNKSAIILFQKNSTNKFKNNLKQNNKNNNNFTKHFKIYKNKEYDDKKNKTLNNTFQNGNYLKLKENKSDKNKINKRIKVNLSLNNHSNENYNSKNFYKIKYNKSYNKTNNHNITNISVCLTNINMINKNEENYSPSFCKINKKIHKKIYNKKKVNKNNIRSKTFDNNFGNLFKKNSYNNTYNNTFEGYLKKEKERDKNKTLMEKKMRYFLDYCKDATESILNSDYDSKSNTLNNYSLNSKFKKINKKYNYKSLDKKRQNLLNNESFNTYNFGITNLSEINSSYLNKCHNISTVTNNNKNNKKKPRVDTFEYLAKILNSINTTNLIKSFKIKGKNEEISKNLKKNEKTDCFRQQNNKNIINNYKNERRFKKDNNIKKYIEIKKKMNRINKEKKKKKNKEDNLKKFIHLYKLQENIFNSNNNKIKNDFYCGKNKKSNNKNYNDINNNTNINVTSNESTIIDKSNYYQNIIDIQKIYNENNIFIDNNIINNENKFINKDNIIIHNDINYNTYDNNLSYINKEKNLDNKSNLNKTDKEIDNKIILNNINDEDIFTKCQITLEKANKIIGGEKVESLINNFNHMNFKNVNNIKEEDNNNNYPLYDYKNDYSFKLNDSNSNEYNSYQTSKFCTSQVLIEEKETNEPLNNNNTLKQDENLFNNNSIKKEENETKNNMQSIQLPPTIQLISGNNTIEENKNMEVNKDFKNNNKKDILNQEKLDNYKEILSSLFEYIKLITQRNALNDIITYGDIKYKYKIGFSQLIIVIKSLPFNIIRAIQQSQYYHFAFRQLFIPYISRAFHNIKIYSSYKIFFIKVEQILKYIYKKIILRKIKNFNKNMKPYNELKNSEENITIKNLEEISELKDLYCRNDIEEDISESKEMDSIEWENDFINNKQITNRDNSNIINNFAKIYQNENSYSADFNINIKEIVFEDDNQG